MDLDFRPGQTECGENIDNVLGPVLQRENSAAIIYHYVSHFIKLQLVHGCRMGKLASEDSDWRHCYAHNGWKGPEQTVDMTILFTSKEIPTSPTDIDLPKTAILESDVLACLNAKVL